MRDGRFAMFGEARTVSRNTGISFKAHKCHVITVKSPVPVPRFPPDFPFSISHPRSEIPKHRPIYYLDRHSFSGKWYMALKDYSEPIIMF